MIHLRWSAGVEAEVLAASESFKLYVQFGLVPYVDGVRISHFYEEAELVEFRFRPTASMRILDSDFLSED